MSFLAPHLDSEESSSSDSEEEDDSSALLGLPHPLSGQVRKRYTFIQCSGSGFAWISIIAGIVSKAFRIFPRILE